MKTVDWHDKGKPEEVTVLDTVERQFALPKTLPMNTRQAAGISWKKSRVNALPASILGVGCYNIKSPKKGSPQYFAQYFLDTSTNAKKRKSPKPQ